MSEPTNYASHGNEGVNRTFRKCQELELENNRLHDEVCQWKERCADLRERLDATCHVLVESGVVPGGDCACRCEACRQVSISMNEAGYLDHVKDRWWEAAKAGGSDES